MFEPTEQNTDVRTVEIPIRLYNSLIVLLGTMYRHEENGWDNNDEVITAYANACMNCEGR